MNIKELIDKLKDYPQDTQVETSITLYINGQSMPISRRAEYPIYDEKMNKIYLLSDGDIKLFY